MSAAARAVRAPAPAAAPPAARPAWLDAVEGEAARLEPVSLAELGGAALMDRVDTKFMLPAGMAARVLRRAAPHYRVLEVCGRRLCRYSTVYFDTAGLAFYHAHHGGRATRRKVRVRTYADTGLTMLEVKLRTNKGRTHKARVPLPPGEADPLRHLGLNPCLGAMCGVPAAELGAVLKVEYTRVTLVSRHTDERVTMDLMLEFARGPKRAGYPAVAIVEVKQPRSGHSPFVALMRDAHARRSRISKYCLGTAALEPRAKTNLYKPVLSRLRRTAESHDAIAIVR